jgi:putative Mg2+ transporter-C (MgtC) family protein
MPIELHWPGIALRLALTVAAGALLGVERSKTGHAAGLRTTLLVSLAASIAMIQMNLLLPTNGKPHDSYAVMDLMRLPLGILTGVGFIGAGVIVRKNELILGVTTAATMWFATVVGLCMGGGQLVLGSVSAVIGFAILWGFRYVERRVERYQIAELRIVMQGDRLLPDELRERLKAADFRIKSLTVTNSVREHERKLECEVRWPSPRGSVDVPALVSEFERLPGVIQIEWKAWGSGPQ